MSLHDLIRSKKGSNFWGNDNPLVTLQHSMNKLFEDFSTGFSNMDLGWPKESTFGHFVPKINMNEDEKSIEITAEIPGVDEKDIQVTLNNDILTIKGEKKSETETKDKGVHRSERVYGYFHRSIALPAEVEFANISATFKNGVLFLKCPKSPKAQSNVKKIEIQSS